MGALTAAGVARQRPRSGLRRAVALVTLFSLLTQTSTPIPLDDEDYPDTWTDGWSDSFSGGADGSGDLGGDGGDGGGDGGGGDGGGGGM
jgi:uncharacterized membrane protein YgcG